MPILSWIANLDYAGGDGVSVGVAVYLWARSRANDSTVVAMERANYSSVGAKVRSNNSTVYAKVR